jgi:hypothetical protein
MGDGASLAVGAAADDADDDVELAVEAGGRDREGGGLHQGLGVKVLFDGLAVDDDGTGAAGEADAGRGGLRRPTARMAEDLALIAKESVD